MATKIDTEDGIGRMQVRPIGFGAEGETAQPVDATHGLPVNIVAGSSAGTEYVEDAAAAANPSGGALILIRQDTLSALAVSADGDNIAARATPKGELVVRDGDMVTLLTATNALLTTQAGYLDGLEGFVDGIETLIGTTNTNTGNAATSLAIIDDWDEGDRCKVNPIVGQAGVAAGAGAVGATVQRMTLASDDPLVARVPAALGGGGGLKVDPAPCDYEPVAVSQTDQMCGSTGAIGDRLDGVLIIPTSTSPGAVSIEDGSTNTIIFEGGASSVSNLIPFFVPMGTQGIVSVSGGWEITTGANVRAIPYGQFT